mgnify:FL=1
MVRNILGVVVGYISMFIFVFISFTALYFILGAEGAFEPETYQVSIVWIIISFVLSIIAALLGGYVCKLISKKIKAVYTLAGVVFVLGIVFAIPALSNSNDEVHEIRNTDVPNMEAMQKAKQPPFVALLNPLIGAIGVIAGGRLKKSE